MPATASGPVKPPQAIPIETETSVTQSEVRLTFDPSENGAETRRHFSIQTGIAPYLAAVKQRSIRGKRESIGPAEGVSSVGNAKLHCLILETHTWQGAGYVLC